MKSSAGVSRESFDSTRSVLEKINRLRKSVSVVFLLGEDHIALDRRARCRTDQH